MSITETDRGIAQIPRRLGFFVRMRVRVGMLPGQVSTAALVQARRYRWMPLIALPIIGVFTITFAGIAIFGNDTHDVDVTVANVFNNTSGTAELVLNDGVVMYFDHRPEVHSGQRLIERVRGSQPIGVVVDGRYIASTRDTGGPPVFGFVFALLWTGLLMLMTSPTLVWGRRAYKQVSSDLGAPVATTRGRYLGSWTWRGLTNRFFVAQRVRTGHISGFPVAIQERGDEPSWFAAPIELLTEVRHFEEAIARGSREVVVTYHPATRAIAKLQAADGSAELDLQRMVDELHPESGLQLRVSRRRRKAHLPDF